MAVETFGVELLSSAGIEDDSFEIWSGRLIREGSSEEIKIKRLLYNPSEDENVRLRNEIGGSPSFGINSKHICKVHGTTLLDGRISVLISHYKETLCTRQKKVGIMNAGDIQRFGEQICLALATLHDRGKFMGSMDSRKFVIDQSENCLLADFGTSWFYNEQSEKAISLTHFQYISPEEVDPDQWGGLSPRTDSWNLACVLLEMATGHRPWVGLARSEQVNKILNGEIPPIPTLPTQLYQLLTRCLSIDPLDRPKVSSLLPIFRSEWTQTMLTTSSDPQSVLSNSSDSIPGKDAKSSVVSLTLPDLGKSESTLGNDRIIVDDAKTVSSDQALLLSNGKINTAGAASKEVQQRSLEDSILLSQKELQDLRALQSNWAALRQSFLEQLQWLTNEKETITAEKVEAEDKLAMNVKEFNEQSQTFQSALFAACETMEKDQKLLSDLIFAVSTAKSKSEKDDHVVGTVREELNKSNCTNRALERKVAESEIRLKKLLEDSTLNGSKQAKNIVGLEEKVSQLQAEIARLRANNDENQDAIKASHLNTEKLLRNLNSLQAENRKIQNQYLSEQKMWATSTAHSEQLLQKIVALESENHLLINRIQAKEEENRKITELLAMHKKIWETEKEVLESQTRIDKIPMPRQHSAQEDPGMELAFEKIASLCGVCLSILNSSRALQDFENESGKVRMNSVSSHPSFATAGQQIIAALRICHPQSKEQNSFSDETTQISALASAARVNNKPQQAEALYRLAVLTFRIHQIPHTTGTANELESLYSSSKTSPTAHNGRITSEFAHFNASPDLATSPLHDEGERREQILTKPSPDVPFVGIKAVTSNAEVLYMRTVSNYVSTPPKEQNMEHSIFVDLAGDGNRGRRTPPLLAQQANRSATYAALDQAGQGNFQRHDKGKNAPDQRLVLGLVLEGTVVAKILPGSPSSLAGLKVGDEVAVINGFSVTSNDAIRILREAMDRASQYRTLSPEGDIEMRISVLRGSSTHECRVVFQGNKLISRSAPGVLSERPPPPQPHSWSPWANAARESAAVAGPYHGDDRPPASWKSQSSSGQPFNAGTQAGAAVGQEQKAYTGFEGSGAVAGEIRSPVSSPPEISQVRGGGGRSGPQPDGPVSSQRSGASLIF